MCFDGDADRLIVIDEAGNVIDGDQILALFATKFRESGALSNNTVVASVVSNMGLENHLRSRGINVKRTPVGDRYVVEEMRRGGFNLGGENSGHIIMLDHARASDGLIAGLQFLSLLVDSGGNASELTSEFDLVPQVIANVRFEGKSDPLSDNRISSEIRSAQQRIKGKGRVWSGLPERNRSCASWPKAKMSTKSGDRRASSESGNRVRLVKDREPRLRRDAQLEQQTGRPELQRA